MSWATSILLGVAAYTAIGVVVGLAFVIFGVARVDPAAQRTPVTFRAIILPGAAALWPWILARWLRAASSPGSSGDNP